MGDEKERKRLPPRQNRGQRTTPAYSPAASQDVDDTAEAAQRQSPTPLPEDTTTCDRHDGDVGDDTQATAVHDDVVVATAAQSVTGCEDAAAPDETNQNRDQDGSDDADDDDVQSAVAPSSPHTGAKRQIANEAQQTVAPDHGSDDNDATMTQLAEPRRSKRLKAADGQQPVHAAEPPCERLCDDVYAQYKVANTMRYKEGNGSVVVEFLEHEHEAPWAVCLRHFLVRRTTNYYLAARVKITNNRTHQTEEYVVATGSVIELTQEQQHISHLTVGLVWSAHVQGRSTPSARRWGVLASDQKSLQRLRSPIKAEHSGPPSTSLAHGSFCVTGEVDLANRVANALVMALNKAVGRPEFKGHVNDTRVALTASAKASNKRQRTPKPCTKAKPSVTSTTKSAKALTAAAVAAAAKAAADAATEAFTQAVGPTSEAIHMVFRQGRQEGAVEGKIQKLESALAVCNSENTMLKEQLKIARQREERQETRLEAQLQAQDNRRRDEQRRSDEQPSCAWPTFQRRVQQSGPAQQAYWCGQPPNHF